MKLNRLRILALLVSFLQLAFVSLGTLKGVTTAAQANSEIEIKWSSFKDDHLNPMIVFWNKNSHPSLDNNFIPYAWSYTYGGTITRNEYSTASGSVKVPTPKEQGVYDVFYCYTGTNDKKVCPVSIPISIVKCRSGGKPQSLVSHIIIILTENHSFDSIYGKYCKAPAFSEPKCTEGPKCCEAIPETLHGIKPFPLTDLENSRFSPCHSNDCEVSEMNGGRMDKYLFGGTGSDPHNYAACTGKEDSCEHYWDWARGGAIADRFFQSSPGASSQGNMFFSSARYMFLDNTYVGQNNRFNGSRCFSSGFYDYNVPSIADLMNACGVSWTFFAEGFDENPSADQCYPLYYDSSDNPFTYFSSLTDSPTASQNFRDLSKLEDDIHNGSLPSVSYVKGLGIHSEHPGYHASLNEGQKISRRIMKQVASSAVYQKNTVVIVVPDESGGYYDHVKPPQPSTIDGFPYGPRTQFVAVGDQVKKNYVSHVQMEPSSLVKFIEWNWLEGTGQLSARDTVCNNIGDIFDPLKTGVKIPSN